MTSADVDRTILAPDRIASGRRWATLAWALLVFLLVSNIPLFLCMPLNDDAALYDVQASNLVRGGVLYRDIFEPNLPGMIWLQVLIRLVLGPSSVALRAADLAFLAAAIWLLGRWVKHGGGSSAALAGASFACVLYYLSTSEWCHCQRDVWLLLPGLVGLTLRCRQIDRLRTAARQGTQTRSASEREQSPAAPLESAPAHGASEGASGHARLRVGLVSTPTANGMPLAGLWALCEGLCWGAGVWIKPMIVVPAACCWILSALFVGSWRQSLVDLIGLLLGGLVIGGLGVAWLIWSGAWPYFLATWVDWNPRYVAAGRENWTLVRYAAMHFRFFPWQLIHLAAVPVAAATVIHALRTGWTSRKAEKPKSREVEKSRGGAAEVSDFSASRPFNFSTSPLLAAFYVAWLIQSYALQHLFDYVHTAEVLLAIAVLAGVPCRWRSWSLIIAGFLAVALVISPAVRFERLARWSQCLLQGPSPELYDRLRLLSMTDWRDLDRVGQYVSGLGLRDRELTCFHNGLVHLYSLTGNRPSTRYVFLESLSVYFPDRHRVLLHALSASPQRYVVSDIRALGVRGETFCPEGSQAARVRFPPPLRDAFPWSQPVVFRAGRYLVHRVEGPLGTLERRAGWPASREPSEPRHPPVSAGTKQTMETSSP